VAKEPAFLEDVSSYFVKQPSPLLTWETVQVVLYREILDYAVFRILDYAVFRTEESRELNTVVTPDRVSGTGRLSCLQAESGRVTRTGQSAAHGGAQ